MKHINIEQFLNGELTQQINREMEAVARNIADPSCKPYQDTIRKLNSGNFRIRYKALRNLSNNFMKRKDVREYIFSRKGRACYLCGGTDDLQIDHKISVYQGAMNQIPYYIINSFENLMPICRKCNSGKKVEE